MASRRSLALAIIVVVLGILALLAVRCSRTAKSEPPVPVVNEKPVPAAKAAEAVDATKPMESAKTPEVSKPAEVANVPETEKKAPEVMKKDEAEEVSRPADESAPPVASKEPETVAVAARLITTQPESTASDATVVTYTWEKSERVPFKMVRIPAGNFVMGSPEVPEAKAVEVTLSQSFLIGETEVTQELYSVVMEDNPSHFRSPQRPVERVSWEDAMAFCEKLNAHLTLPEGWRFTLPSEAQWEYAAKAGAAGNYGGAATMDEAGWYVDNSNQWGEDDMFFGKKRFATHDVAKKKANAWGLYDMNGNVWEWCSDWYVKDFKKDNDALLTDPAGPETGSYRVRRGGSWWDNALFSRNDYRSWYAPKFKRDHVGFRVALVRVPDQSN